MVCSDAYLVIISMQLFAACCSCQLQPPSCQEVLLGNTVAGMDVEDVTFEEKCTYASSTRSPLRLLQTQLTFVSWEEGHVCRASHDTLCCPPCCKHGKEGIDLALAALPKATASRRQFSVIEPPNVDDRGADTLTNLCDPAVLKIATVTVTQCMLDEESSVQSCYGDQKATLVTSRGPLCWSNRLDEFFEANTEPVHADIGSHCKRSCSQTDAVGYGHQGNSLAYKLVLISYELDKV